MSVRISTASGSERASR